MGYRTGRLSIFMLNSAVIMDLKSLTDKSIVEAVCCCFFFYQRVFSIEDLSLKLVVQNPSKLKKNTSESIALGY